jgi:hypothetical protein
VGLVADDGVLTRWSGAALTASITACLGGGCVFMDKHMVVVMFGVVEASLTCMKRIMQISTLNMGRWFDDDDDF